MGSLWIGQEIILLSPHARDDCLARLGSAASVSPAAVSQTGSYPVVARQVGQAFRIRKRISYRNSFQTIVSVTLCADGFQTRVRCRSGIDPFVVALTTGWFGILAAVEIAVGASSLGSGGVPDSFVVAPLGIMAAGAGIIGWGRWMAEDEFEFVAGFLRSRLQATH